MGSYRTVSVILIVIAIFLFINSFQTSRAENESNIPYRTALTDYYSSFNSDIIIIDYTNSSEYNNDYWDPKKNGKSIIMIDPFSPIKPGDTVTITFPTTMVPLAWASSNTNLLLGLTDQQKAKGISLSNFEAPKDKAKYWDSKIERYYQPGFEPYKDEINPKIVFKIPNNSALKGETITGYLSMDIIYADAGYGTFVNKEYQFQRRFIIPVMTDEEINKLPQKNSSDWFLFKFLGSFLLLFLAVVFWEC
jgi:hypothetical protein